MARLNALLGEEKKPHIHPGEAWSDAALADLDAMSESSRGTWRNLLMHAQSATTSKPSAKWLKEAKAKVEAVGFDAFKATLLRWFPLVDQPRTGPLAHRPYGGPAGVHSIAVLHSDFLKGLVWSCGAFDDRDLARAVSRLALSSFRKIPGVGPRLVSLGNACVVALGMMPGMETVGQLAFLKVKVKSAPAFREIEKALEVAAKREGLPVNEIEELGVPAYGLEEVGRRRETIGEYVAELIVEGSDATLRWSKLDGKPLKSVPAAAKKEHADEVKELTATTKDVGKMLGASASGSTVSSSRAKLGRSMFGASVISTILWSAPSRGA